MSNLMKPPEYSASPVSGSTQPHRKSRRWVWITLGVFALLCVLGGALVWTFGVNPAIAGEQYYIAIRNQDYAKAYSYLGSDLRARFSQEAFTQQAQQQDAALGRVTQYTYFGSFVTVSFANVISPFNSLLMRSQAPLRYNH